MAEEEKEEPRLYSKPAIAPIDDSIAPQHQTLHMDLESYGRWCREKYQPGTCESIEGRFDPGEGGRKSKDAQVSLPENPMYRRLDKVIRHMRMQMPDHGEALKLYYVGRPVGMREGPGVVYVRCSPRVICRILHRHWSTFGQFMFDSRAAVLNLLRRQGEVRN